MTQLSISALRLLYELQQRGTLTAAAEAVHINRSAASHKLATLQRVVGVGLTEKIGRTIRLTEAGSVLAQHAERVLREIEEAATIAERLHGAPAGTVRLGAIQTVAVRFLADAVAELCAAYPTLRVEARCLTFANAVVAVAAGEIDVAVVASYDKVPLTVTEGLSIETLCRDGVRLALPVCHPLADRRAAVDVAELSADHWICDEPDTYLGKLVPTLCRRAGFTPEIVHRSADHTVTAAWVAAGHGIALLPSVAELHRWPGVVTTDISADDVGRDIVAVIRESSRSRPAAQAALTALRATARAQAATGVRT